MSDDGKLPGAARVPRPRIFPLLAAGMAGLLAGHTPRLRAGYGGAGSPQGSGFLSARFMAGQRNGRHRWKKLRATGYVSMRRRRKRRK